MSGGERGKEIITDRDAHSNRRNIFSIFLSNRTVRMYKNKCTRHLVFFSSVNQCGNATTYMYEDRQRDMCCLRIRRKKILNPNTNPNNNVFSFRYKESVSQTDTSKWQQQ